MAKKKEQVKQKALKITLVKSPIGYEQRQKETVRSLGLRRLHATVIHNDAPHIRGMIHRVRHLVVFEEIEKE
jgi:large subunit ribosomal protein L30